jgi:hypothetical protein
MSQDKTTLTAQCSPSWRNWRIENLEEDYNPLSIFNIYPPAKPEDIATAIKELMASFKQMNKTEEDKEFWKLLAKQLKKLAWSKERIEYAVDRMVRNHEYLTFTIADVVSKDKEFKVFTYEQADSLKGNEKEFAKIKLDKWYIVFKEDAIKNMIPYEDWYTTQQLKELGKI